VCDAIANRFRIDSVPNVTFLRGGGTPERIIGQIKGAAPDFKDQFERNLAKSLTKQEQDVIAKFNSNSPGLNIISILENMATDEDEVRTLSTHPLKECDLFLLHSKRSELGLPDINPELIFDVSPHEASKTAPARSVLGRFNDDVKAFADEANTLPLLKMVELTDGNVLDYFRDDLVAKERLREGQKQLQTLMSKLEVRRDIDSSMIQNTVPLLETAANWVRLDASDDAASRRSKIKFLLSRVAGHNAFVWIEFLFGALLSSKGENDLLKLNPYLQSSTVNTLFGLVAACMLRANRLGLTNRCIGTVISLQALLKKVELF
jgi:hypothetical protein